MGRGVFILDQVVACARSRGSAPGQTALLNPTGHRIRYDVMTGRRSQFPAGP
jgi:hypothetical protein